MTKLSILMDKKSYSGDKNGDKGAQEAEHTEEAKLGQVNSPLL